MQNGECTSVRNAIAWSGVTPYNYQGKWIDANYLNLRKAKICLASCCCIFFSKLGTTMLFLWL